MYAACANFHLRKERNVSDGGIVISVFPSRFSLWYFGTLKKQILLCSRIYVKALSHAHANKMRPRDTLTWMGLSVYTLCKCCYSRRYVGWCSCGRTRSTPVIVELFLGNIINDRIYGVGQVASGRAGSSTVSERKVIALLICITDGNGTTQIVRTTEVKFSMKNDLA